VFEKSSPWWGYPLFLQNFLISIPTNAAGPLRHLVARDRGTVLSRLAVVVRYCPAQSGVLRSS